MNVHHKPLTVDDERRSVRTAPAPLRARPVKNPRSEKEFFEDVDKRFSKTLAYLAAN